MKTQSTDIETLRLTAGRTAEALRAIRQRRDEYARERLRIEEERITEEMEALYGDAIREAERAASDAAKALTEVAELVALTGDGCSVPLGSRLVRWERAYAGGPKKPTKTGIVEAITRNSLHPAKSSGYSRANVGEFVIRILKQDGTPGAKYVKMGGWGGSDLTNYNHGLVPYGWYPEGVRPNA